jgi:hypothetical protein
MKDQRHPALPPTAQALDGEVALTPSSSSPLTGLGLATLDQPVPFQRRIRVTGAVPVPPDQ